MKMAVEQILDQILGAIFGITYLAKRVVQSFLRGIHTITYTRSHSQASNCWVFHRFPFRGIEVLGHCPQCRWT